MVRMPSVPHDLLVALFEKRPTLAPELLRDVLHQTLPVYDSATIESADFTQVVSTEYRADLVVLLHNGVPVFGIVIEVQLGIDENKRYTWPLYSVTLRAKVRCPTCVLVVTRDASVANWAARPVDLGPGASFAPLVLGPNAVPWVTDVEEAKKTPELAVLSVQAHGEEAGGLEIAIAAMTAASGLDDERATLYYHFIYMALSEAAKRELERLMQSGSIEIQSEFAKKHFSQGEAKGRAAGKAEGKAEGEAIGLAEAVLGVFEARDVAVPAEVRQRIGACDDIDTLKRWLKRAVLASSPTDIFAGD
jgi:hypothetical protein